MPNLTSSTVERALLLLILLVYLIVGGLFALQTPDWQSPDEPAHYNYIAQVAADGCCPIIETGDWNAAYQDQLKSARFHPDLLGQLAAIQYEDHQPPLYYVLASVVFKLTSGSLAALRLFSVLIGTLVILSAYGAVRVIFPQQPPIALGTAAFVAFLPQHLAFLASVNNDGLGWALVGITLWISLVYLKTGDLPTRLPAPFVLGLLVGVGFLTKASTYFMAGVVLLVILLRWWRQGKTDPAHEGRATHIDALIRALAWFAIPALILGSLWWLRNFNVYGFPDFLGLRAHDTVVADQPRTAEKIAADGFGAYLGQALETTFNSFWGQFGWMALPMPGWIYTVFKAFGLVVIGGWLVDLVFLRRRASHPAPGSVDTAARSNQRLAWGVLGLVLILAVLQYVYYNTEFLQLQGRYMFSGLIPFALLLTLGLDSWRRWLLPRFAWAEWIVALIFLPLAALDVYLLWKFIVPLLSP